MNNNSNDKYILAQMFLQKSLNEKDPKLSDFYYTQYIEMLFRGDNSIIKQNETKQ